MASKKHNWKKLEAELLAGKYIDLKDMARKTKISYRMIQKMSSQLKWTDKRKRVDDEAQEKGTQLIIDKRAQQIAASDERALDIADKLVKMGSDRFIDPKTGELRKDLILESDATALTAIKTGIHMEQSILKRGGLADKDGDTYNFINQQNIDVKELSNAQLLSIINAKRKKLRSTTT